MHRRIGIALCAAALCASIETRSLAAIGASATITGEHQLPSGQYQYDLSLNNTGTTPISTYWFGWIVYAGTFVYDLMPSAASSVSSPAGWTGASVHDGIGSYAVEWTSPTPLGPGGTLSGFSFVTPDVPGTINGTSFFAGYPTRESWVYQNVYSGVSSSGANAEFTPAIAPAPEPAIGLALIPLLALRRKRRGALA